MFRRLTPPVSGNSSLVAEQLSTMLMVSLRLNRARNGWVARRVTVTWNPGGTTSVTAETGTSLLQAEIRINTPERPSVHPREITWRQALLRLPRLHPDRLGNRHHRDARLGLHLHRCRQQLPRRSQWVVPHQA